MSEVKRYELTEDVATGEVDITPVPDRMEGRFVTFDDYAALQQKLDVVLAENLALKGYIESECYIVDDNSGPMADADVCATERMPKSPATDAILNEVRAEGVEKLITEKSSEWLTSYCEDAREFANQLRAGRTEGGL